MPARLRPALTMSDIYGPGHIFVARAHQDFCDWLPNEAHVLDSLTGGQLGIVGDMPILCSEGFNSAANLDLLALAGLEAGASRIHFAAGEGLAVLSRAAAESTDKLVFQHAYPGHPLEAERCWIDPGLLHDLNNKAKLAELVPAEHLPPRRVADRAEYFERGDQPLPVVLKVVTDQSNGGGCGVTICRTAADLREAERLFERCDRIVVEELLQIVRNPCLNFAVMPGGEVRYLGFADQDISPEGKYRGNWIDAGSPMEEAAIEAAAEPVRRAAAMGYRGVAGVDLAFAPDSRIHVLDLNFRVNGCTAMILLARSVTERSGAGVMHLRKIEGGLGAEALARLLTPYVESSRVVPLGLFDPSAAGYAGKPASAQLLVLGASRDDVLATEAEIEAAAG